jgi:hypothetical protein
MGAALPADWVHSRRMHGNHTLMRTFRNATPASATCGLALNRSWIAELRLWKFYRANWPSLQTIERESIGPLLLA